MVVPHHIATAPPPQQTQSDTEFESNPDAPVSSTGLKGKTKMAQGTGHRKKKKGAGAPSRYTSRSGTGTTGGGRPQGALPFRIWTLPLTLLHYVRGTGLCPKTWMKPFPLLNGSPAGKGDLIPLIVPLVTQATGSHKAEEEDSDQYTYICIYVLM